MDWLDFLAIQETLRSLLQHHSSKASILWRSAFFMVQLSHPYMTTGKTIALTRQTFVGKIISLLFNILSRLVKDFLPRSKCLLISWLQSPSAVILEPKKVKSLTVSIVSPSICHEVMGPDVILWCNVHFINGSLLRVPLHMCYALLWCHPSLSITNNMVIEISRRMKLQNELNVPLKNHIIKIFGLRNSQISRKSCMNIDKRVLYKNIQSVISKECLISRIIHKGRENFNLWKEFRW